MNKEIKWIDNTKQQPEKSGRYLISLESELVDIDYYDKYLKDWSVYSKHDITAWAPLPTNYTRQ